MKQFVAGTVVGAVGALTLLSAAWAGSQTDYASLDLFVDVMERVHANYIQEISVPDLVERAVDGMLNSLDPHSRYISGQEFADMQNARQASMAGVGVELTMEYGLTKVISAIDDTPASQGGLKPGDYITQIDGKSIAGDALDAVIALLRGTEGSTITLTIRRNDVPQPFDVVLTRTLIHAQTVKYERKDNVGYIRISALNEATETQLRKAVADLKSQIGAGLKGYVIDLRNDPGGLLDQTIKVSDDFLNDGAILSTHGRNSMDSQTYTATPGDVTDGKPIAILINEGTASGAEIIAGALQDYGRATIIGMKSFGEGTVQTIIPVPGKMGGALRLTTSKFYRPHGGEIQATGITPDFAVAPLPESDSKARRALVVSETELPRHFAAELQSAPANPSVIYPDKKYDDFQLAFALGKLYGK